MTDKQRMQANRDSLPVQVMDGCLEGAMKVIREAEHCGDPIMRMVVQDMAFAWIRDQAEISRRLAIAYKTNPKGQDRSR